MSVYSSILRMIFCHKKIKMISFFFFAKSVKMKAFVLVLLGVTLMASSLEAAATELGNNLVLEAAYSVAAEAEELDGQALAVENVVASLERMNCKKQFWKSLLPNWFIKSSSIM
jgi:hypothetical protein